MIYTKNNYTYQDWGHLFTPLDDYNEHKLDATEIINHSPQLLKDIQKARQSLNSEKLLEDKDLFKEKQ